MIVTSCPARDECGAFGEGLIINCSSSCSNTERLNPRGTNPVRKSLSLYAVPCGVSRYPTHTRNIFVRADAHTYIYTCDAERRDLTFECGTGSSCLPRVLRPRVYISTGDRSALLQPSLSLSFTPEGPKKRSAQQK